MYIYYVECLFSDNVYQLSLKMKRELRIYKIRYLHLIHLMFQIIEWLSNRNKTLESKVYMLISYSIYWLNVYNLRAYNPIFILWLKHFKHYTPVSTTKPECKLSALKRIKTHVATHRFIYNWLLESIQYISIASC